MISESIDIIEEKEIARRYSKLYCGVKAVEDKLKNLTDTKEVIAEERFTALEKEYSDLLKESKPILETITKTIDSKMDLLFEELEPIEKKLNQIQLQINQEKKLYDVGAISKDEYAKKMRPLKTEQKNEKNDLKSIIRKIKILKEAKDNPRKPKYVPPDVGTDHRNGIEYFTDAFKKFSDFSGRATRKEFWMFFLFNMIFTIVLTALEVVPGVIVLQIIYMLVLTVPYLSITARRLHDTGRSGWWQLISVIPFIGHIVLIVFLVQDSHDDNEYGPNPKMV